MNKEGLKFTDNTDDEIVVVQLPRKEYELMRKMIQREETMSNVWRWIRTFLFVLIGGVLTLVTFGEAVLKYLNGVVK
jgi:hypothetical protein